MGTRITISPAERGDLPGLHELSVRTHQLNSGGKPVTEAELADLIGSARHQVATLRPADDFGDDGLVGAAILTRNGAGQPVPSVMTALIVMMSCRTLGRGALDALLARAGRPVPGPDRNVPMRLALAAVGQRADPGSVAADGRAIFMRSLGGDLPTLPDWVTIAGTA